MSREKKEVRVEAPFAWMMNEAYEEHYLNLMEVPITVVHVKE